MVLSEAFQVAAIIEKLPPGWKDFKNYLKHKQKEMNVEELIVRLRIEEDNRRSEKRGSSQSATGRAQNVMYNGKSRHIRWSHNIVRQLISTGVISVDYVKSKDNIADLLTKGLNRELVEKSSRGMRLKPIKMKSQYDENLT